MIKNFNINGKSFVFEYCEDTSIDFTLKSEKDGISIYRVAFNWESPTAPKKVTLLYSVPCVDTYTMWDPIEKLRNLPFGERQTDSRLASGMPLKGVLSRSGNNRLLVSVSDLKSPIGLGIKAGIWSGNLECSVNFFTMLTGPFANYEAEIRIDTRDIPFDSAVYDAREWFNALGYKNAYVPQDAKFPMYSTWYSYGQSVSETAVIKECEKAVKLGMKAVILDDGWQTDNLESMYGYCGDWIPIKRKFPDMRAFCEKIHLLGMKVIVWFSVPFMGKYSKNCKRFNGKYLCYYDNSDCYALDPRYKEVREFLVKTYATAVKEWNLDGLKLDFIDRFKANGEYSSEMDFVSVENAVEQLLQDITVALKAINPDILIEFRQPYFGPVVSAYGNMMRVWDCPLDGGTNKNQTINLRLVSGSCAVHSDMIYWSREDSPQSVALQLYGTVFSVPQISARLDEITQEQGLVLKSYLNFWNEHRQTLTEGKLKVRFCENGYGYAESTVNGETVAMLSAVTVFENTANAKTCYAINLTDSKEIILKLVDGQDSTYSVFDCFGKEISWAKADEKLSLISVPLGGMIKVTYHN